MACAQPALASPRALQGLKNLVIGCSSCTLTRRRPRWRAVPRAANAAACPPARPPARPAPRCPLNPSPGPSLQPVRAPTSTTCCTSAWMPSWRWSSRASAWCWRWTAPPRSPSCWSSGEGRAEPTGVLSCRRIATREEGQGMWVLGGPAHHAPASRAGGTFCGAWAPLTDPLPARPATQAAAAARGGPQRAQRAGAGGLRAAPRRPLLAHAHHRHAAHAGGAPEPGLLHLRPAGAARQRAPAV